MHWVLTALHEGGRDIRKLENGKSEFIQMSTFGYQLPCQRYLDLSVLMLIYFIIKSCTRCIGRCNPDINGRILGAKCLLYLVSVPQKQIRLLCAPPVALPFHISSCLASSAAEGKCLGSFSTPFCSFSSSEPLTAALSQNGLRIEAGQWSQDNRNGNVFLVWLHFLMTTVLWIIITWVVEYLRVKFPWRKPCHSVFLKQGCCFVLFFFFPLWNKFKYISKSELSFRNM